MQMAGKCFHLMGGCIAPHKADTGDVIIHLSDKCIKAFLRQRQPYVSPQLRAVAPWAMTRATREVDGKSCLVRYFLKHYVSIEVLKHFLLCIYPVSFSVIVSAVGFLLTSL